ncbi:hypothetical protein P22_3390 [Propionispora sp. 2/2-37]|uniref:hydroxyacid dehydrogenase n=1 Tax=Propionispora sp. 2/2-37 TaxID=1677858 RepID=UPI0006BB942E|nr:hydroxyacid dehydrogenase [Propionispora sp. 2/2-37]CUH97263.1 hypothetical protein P22_3390 [Propionispora sp. 2/2-37]
MPKTVLLSHALYETGMDVLRKNVNVLVANNSDMSGIIDDLKKADGLILRVGKITREIMEQCPNLKVIARPGVGVDNVDMKAATELGIPVVVAPGTNKRSVAEHAVGMAYAITKNIVESHQETVQGNFNIRNKYTAIELEQHHVGIVGFGNIGKETAKIFANNQMQVHVYDPFVEQEIVETNYQYIYHAELADLLRVCDIISLHMPSLPSTQGMFNAERFAQMKDGIFIVNCARGDIVDEEALYEALKSGKVAGAAADVLCSEPMDISSKLFSLPNFIATPHMAALTRESADRTSRLTVEGTLAVLRGEKWDKVANKEVYQHERWQ